MTARLIEIFLPETRTDELETILNRSSRRFWRETVPGDQEKFSCIVQQRYTERLLDELERAFGQSDGFFAQVLTLEATLPPVDETPQTELPGFADAPPPTRLERFFSRDRLSTKELYDDIEENLHIRPSFLLTVFLSAIIAGLGMNTGQTAVVIGAMIIAPLLGPTMGMAMAATIGDGLLAKRSAAALLAGTLIAILAGALVGWLVQIDPQIAELRNRTIVQPADIALSLACGAAGVLAFSRGSSLTLVGVMIAVALVPPLAAAGIFAATQDLPLAGGAFYLFIVNLVCVNVAGIATLLFQGLPPKSWRMTGGILGLWTFILFVLFLLMTGRFAFGVAGTGM